MELEKSPFGKHSSNNSGKKNQWLMKLQGERRMRNGFYIVSECLPRRCHINQVIKVNTVSIGTNRHHHVPLDRMQWEEPCVSSVKSGQKFIIWLWSRRNIRQTQTENHSAQWSSWIINNVKVIKSGGNWEAVPESRHRRRRGNRVMQDVVLRQKRTSLGPLDKGCTGHLYTGLATFVCLKWFPRRKIHKNLHLEDCWSLPCVASGPSAKKLWLFSVTCLLPGLSTRLRAPRILRPGLIHLHF